MDRQQPQQPLVAESTRSHHPRRRQRMGRRRGGGGAGVIQVASSYTAFARASGVRLVVALCASVAIIAACVSYMTSSVAPNAQASRRGAYVTWIILISSGTLLISEASGVVAGMSGSSGHDDGGGRNTAWWEGLVAATAVPVMFVWAVIILAKSGHADILRQLKVFNTTARGAGAAAAVSAAASYGLGATASIATAVALPLYAASALSVPWRVGLHAAIGALAVAYTVRAAIMRVFSSMAMRAAAT